MIKSLCVVGCVLALGSLWVQLYAQQGGDQLARFLRFLAVVAFVVSIVIGLTRCAP